MPAEIVTVPCLTDNYAFLLHDAGSGACAVIDVPEAEPVIAALDARGWRASHILITHHHADHVQGVSDVAAATGAVVVGAAADAHRLPPLDRAVAEGDRIDVGGIQLEVIEVPGHTLGHVAFDAPAAGAVFTADSLMALGCGRLFEGTPAQMWSSLMKLAALPDDRLVCSGHEYTEANARFALTIEPDNPELRRRAAEVHAARAAGRPTVPSRLGEEKATNPFLRAHLPQVKRALGMEGADDVAVFAEIRARKDRF
ncbi:hydroxyacylglutathione hydrolase [Meinhardsimonia xiamenensis]|uniref:Hydroxyacylglutathione hydrolase n=1 Tax=Meinhardsimonia xiamenensis TaxID=990712 RepID=A0A1G8YTY3_9RHOB|nr:hydroxyacylglutathione hydrolase [Meinhardsimonia xiamenensis]PRX37438.1 hydroxyacylglutathione hydrolase [Meinhardsimonia xiamenensis]SDK06299.1 hydroxyacylglutathione hydrolase [Meinhardsimonia xiamenensis]